MSKNEWREKINEAKDSYRAQSRRWHDSGYDDDLWDNIERYIVRVTDKRGNVIIQGSCESWKARPPKQSLEFMRNLADMGWKKGTIIQCVGAKTGTVINEIKIMPPILRRKAAQTSQPSNPTLT